jgi:DNA-binding CsgD family transcriptional regulator
MLERPWPREPLLAVLRLMSEGSEPDTIGRALVEDLLREHTVSALSAYFVVDGGEALEERVHYGRSRDAGRYSVVSLDTVAPLTEAFRTGESSAWRTSDAAAEFPAVAGWAREHPEFLEHEWLATPIRGRGTVVGVLLVSRPGSSERGPRLQGSMEAAAIALSLWWLSQPRAAHSLRPARSSGTVVTPRQRAIVAGLRAGRTNARIAADLGVSVGTVKADLAVLYRNYDVADRQALLAALRPRRSADPPQRSASKVSG